MAHTIFPTAAAMLLAAAAFGSAQDPPAHSPQRRSPIGPHIPPKDVPAEDQGKSGDKLVKVRAVPDAEIIGPGQTCRVAFILDIEPHWHIYWKNSGATGAPTEVRIKAPPGFAVKRTLFPRPRTFTDEEGITYGYEGQTVLFVDITAPVELHSGAAMFSADINWLVCKSVCLMGRTTQTFSLNTRALGSPGAESPRPTPEPVVATFLKRLPLPLKDEKTAAISIESGKLEIRAPSRGRNTASFFPIDSPGMTYGEPKVTPEGDHVGLTIPVEVNPVNSLGRSPVAAGLIALGTGPDDPCFEFEFPLPAP